ncbi:PREDICTED: auxin-responsive protein SAUR68-like [Nelumbo nucifera]|uniref:Auxin-responsive protein SAUR68-like n=2 Tax=Nelumbo nucifera TaxID=4432 RepID=A0A822ZUR4_NELNU|nr:PREDICTED: auxin-responsive protein SAUR68-like [Nelumbo nucifera]DAD46606.1 TPA_asm: hypothetical protein HUJ06_016543 [Nelumbo nucifera]
MINPKRLVEMARRWRKAAAAGSLRISLPRAHGHGHGHRGAAVADKGHFVVYTIDKKRFVIPLQYLNHSIVVELFKMSEEEFGLPSNGPITLPCDSVFMEYVVSFLGSRLIDSLEKDLLLSTMAGRCCVSSTSSLPHAHRQTNQQLLVHGL